MKIGIIGHGLIGWNGGLDFLAMVTDTCSYIDDVELVVLLPIKGVRSIANKVYMSVKGAKVHSPDINHVYEAFEGIVPKGDIIAIDWGEKSLARAVKKYSIDVLLPSMNVLSDKVQAPWVGYMYDFQHKYLPQNFTNSEIRERDKYFDRMVGKSKSIIVNSQSVVDDAISFCGGSKERIFALPFNAMPKRGWGVADSSVKGRYGIKRPFFIVCNQFWLHKGHDLLFSAFKEFAKGHREVDLICTGLEQDYRRPRYVEGLKDFVRNNSLEDRIRFLGLVPKVDQIQLIKASIGMIQPTKFEGGPGGGSVYDALSLGVPSLVSDIRVNRELTEDGVHFFDANNINDLSCAMGRFFERYCFRDTPSFEELVAKGQERRSFAAQTMNKAIQVATR